MIKKTLEISAQPAHLCVQHQQLQVKRDRQVIGSIPCEDIGMILVDHPQATYTHQALSTLAENGATVVICGADHLPAAIMLPVSRHGEGVWRLKEQIAASVPLQKRLWQQLISAKIRAQAANLDADTPSYRRLMLMAGQVRSGDPSNLEAQAAKIYWQHWLAAGSSSARAAARFRRDPAGDGINSCLNYGYAVLRAALSRAIVGAGLHPSLGLFHQNRSNAFCLADDLIEPFRPLVERQVRLLLDEAPSLDSLTQPIKAALLNLLTHPMRQHSDRGVHTGPMMVMMHRLIASLVRCYSGESKRLAIPVASEPIADEEMATCESMGTE